MAWKSTLLNLSQNLTVTERKKKRTKINFKVIIALCKNRSVNLFTDHSSHLSHISCQVLLGYHLLHRYTWAPVSQASEPMLRNLQGSIRLFIIPPPLCKQTPFTPSGAMVREIWFLYVCRWPLLTFPVCANFTKNRWQKKL